MEWKPCRACFLLLTCSFKVCEWGRSCGWLGASFLVVVSRDLTVARWEVFPPQVVGACAGGHCKAMTPTSTPLEEAAATPTWQSISR